MSHLKSLSPAFSVTPEVFVRQISIQYQLFQSFSTCSKTTSGSNQIIYQKGSLVFGSDKNYQESNTSNEIHLTVAIAD